MNCMITYRTSLILIGFYWVIIIIVFIINFEQISYSSVPNNSPPRWLIFEFFVGPHSFLFGHPSSPHPNPAD